MGSSRDIVVVHKKLAAVVAGKEGNRRVGRDSLVEAEGKAVELRDSDLVQDRESVAGVLVVVLFPQSVVVLVQSVVVRVQSVVVRVQSVVVRVQSVVR